ncbi:menaquinone-dependent protoporphyrinogen IX dehydrogenase [Moritella marina ATCC 15381]|uniref:Protoporphyrinogen IX dehydrogenase [quinone] n=1 Tax=Moritella marina ATCC 15381 TaxID=1202962 RepID=A0A5J6WN64_MORMI|nr:menaquinone-dependent protoporphyrinogen IX dehydrogenase [Moritella marina]QFI39576.1 menaquinone-dependent protoporphyrinogen IX dehydrogenase [Moritella marina ATCC 15381]
MKKMLVLYSTVDGQTLKIIKAIEAKINHEYICEIMSIDECQHIDMAIFDKVVIGASVRYGHLNKKLYQFIEANKAQLAAKDNGFFCVNLTARKEGKNTPETNAYMQAFLVKSGWIPKQQAVFAGALSYSKYNWWQTLIIQLIMKITGGSTDKSKDIEFTDWVKVTAFAKTL